MPYPRGLESSVTILSVWVGDGGGGGGGGRTQHNGAYGDVSEENEARYDRCSFFWLYSLQIH